MGEIRVKFYGALNLIPAIKMDKTILKQGSVWAIAGPTSVRKLLEAHQIPVKDVHVIFIGKARATLDAAVTDGDTLHLFPVMGGG